jgi:hypothetical protein
MEGRIRQRAYELFQERGGASGFGHEDWLKAEAEIRAEVGSELKDVEAAIAAEQYESPLVADIEVMPIPGEPAPIPR